MRNYITGFILSLLLTLAAYFSVTNHLFSGYLIFIIVILAFLQLWVQLTYFLKLDQQTKRWDLVVFLGTFVTIAIMVIGSLWIMRNLNYNHGSTKTEQQIIEDEAIPLPPQQ